MIRAAAKNLGSALLVLCFCVAAEAGVPFSERFQESGAAPAGGAVDVSPTQEFERWRARADAQGFAAVEEALRAEFSGPQNTRRLTVFYMAHDLWPEALSVIRKQTNASAELKFYEGVANAQMGRWADALEALSDERLAGFDAAVAWRGLAKAALGAEKAAADDLFAASAPPEPFERSAADFLLARAEIALSQGERLHARSALESLRGRGLDDGQRARRRLVETKLMLAEGKRDTARSLLEILAETGPSPAANRARLILIKDRLTTGEIDARVALAEAETQALAWRGGAFERELLEFTAALHDANGNIAEAFRIRRRLIESFPRSDAAAEARREMTKMLAGLFDQTGLSPMTAAEVFYENINAAPPGREGDALIRGVADELAALDLLKPAGELLRHQVFNRLQGPQRSETAAELAALYLADARPREALQTLRATRYARLPAALDDRRRLLEARALVGVGEPEAALDLVAGDESVAALRLRGDIHWTAEDWRKAGAAYAASLMASGDDAQPVAGADARTALKAVAAFVLAGDDETLRVFVKRIKDRLADEQLKTLVAMLAGGEAQLDTAAFLAAYEDYFKRANGS